VRQGGRMGMLGDLRCQPCISISPGTKMGARGIGLQVERAFESACRALVYEA